MLSGRSDANLVVFLNNLTSIEDQLKQRGEFLKEIEKQLYQLPCEQNFPVTFEVLRSWRNNSPGIILKLSSSELQQEVEFHVLLAYDILGKPVRASAHSSECLHPLFSPPPNVIYRFICGEDVIMHHG